MEDKKTHSFHPPKVQSQHSSELKGKDFWRQLTSYKIFSKGRKEREGVGNYITGQEQLCFLISKFLFSFYFLIFLSIYFY